jgi:hypothetical protein
MTDEAQKICPFRRTDGIAADCLGEKCACHIRMVKPAFIAEKIVDPEHFYSYEGCGLVVNVPWRLEKKPDKVSPQ